MRAQYANTTTQHSAQPWSLLLWQEQYLDICSGESKHDSSRDEDVAQEGTSRVPPHAFDPPLVFGGTPLYTAYTRTSMPLQSTTIRLLLDTGAELENEGGDYGTPLTGACAAGRLQAVKLLARKGGKMLSSSL